MKAKCGIVIVSMILLLCALPVVNSKYIRAHDMKFSYEKNKIELCNACPQAIQEIKDFYTNHGFSGANEGDEEDDDDEVGIEDVEFEDESKEEEEKEEEIENFKMKRLSRKHGNKSMKNKLMKSCQTTDCFEFIKYYRWNVVKNFRKIFTTEPVEFCSSLFSKEIENGVCPSYEKNNLLDTIEITKSESNGVVTVTIETHSSSSSSYYYFTSSFFSFDSNDQPFESDTDSFETETDYYYPEHTCPIAYLKKNRHFLLLIALIFGVAAFVSYKIAKKINKKPNKEEDLEKTTIEIMTTIGLSSPQKQKTIQRLI